MTTDHSVSPYLRCAGNGIVRYFRRIAPAVMAAVVMIGIMRCGKKGDRVKSGHTSTASVLFDEKEYRLRADQAFFSDAARTGLRRLRNEVRARHGGKFRSEDLQRHFERQDWYSANPWYKDGMLSAEEVAFIDDVVKAEIMLAEMPDSLKEYYDDEVAFRKRTDVDTSIISKRDYTGDGENEVQTTRIFRAGQRICVVNTIVSGRDTLLYRCDTAAFAPERFGREELLTEYTTAVRTAPPGVERRPDESWPDYVYTLMADDIAKFTGKTGNGIADDALTSYVRNFKGVLYHTTTSEDGGCVYIWYAPIRKFVTFYCP